LDRRNRSIGCWGGINTRRHLSERGCSSIPDAKHSKQLLPLAERPMPEAYCPNTKLITIDSNPE